MADIPLAEQIRPQTLNDFQGQDHIVGKNGIIRILIEKDKLPSMIFWGPPGSGKTTLARIIADSTNSFFVNFSAVTAKKEDIQKTALEAKERMVAYSQKTIIFLDEIHRFNKAQQDTLLPYVENGALVLIGATTENPSFSVINPLLSRCRVFTLNRLNIDNLNTILERGLKFLKIQIESDAKKLLLSIAQGDARIVLNAIEIASNLSKQKNISLKVIENVFQEKPLQYDHLGEEHYNTISAFIKSMRASDINASLYYLARMVEAGEDPLFIARRMVVFASEDIGLAQPTALVVANEVFRACETVGYPECQINLMFGAAYLAQAKKDRSAYEAYFKAVDDVRNMGNLPIPLKLRNAPTSLMKKLGYSSGYKMYPDKNESLLPDKLKGKKYL